MSGFAAVFDRDGPTSEESVAEPLEVMDYRGRDGTDVEVLDRVVLGHQHFNTTPESVGERQPIEIDGRWIVMDGRLDNRPELFEQLADAGEPASAGISDAELLLRAYLAFGDAFAERLVGAFGAAIWDPRAGRLVVARDKTGIRKLYYADVGSVVVVASEMGAVLAHPAVPTEVDEVFAAEVLSTFFTTPGETYYEAVDPVPTGSLVTVTAGDTTTESYWEAWDADVERDPDKDLAEEFRDRMQAAVACRLRAPTVPSIMMSGGMDSTTIAGFARRHLDRTGRPDADLHSYTLLVEKSEDFDDELARVETAVEAFDLESHTVDATEYYALKELDTYREQAREAPLFSPVVLPSSALYEQAATTGRDVVLMGIGGNMYDGSRLYYTDLVKRGRLGTFVRHALADSLSFRGVVAWYVLAQFSDHFGRFLLEWTDRAEPDVPAWVDDDFVERTGLAERIDRDVETGIEPAAQQQKYKRHFHRAREFEDAIQRRVALRAGVELRTPYVDSRLVSFMVSLPPGELRHADRDKVLFREATADLLPDQVRTQSAAVTFDPIVRTGLYDERREFAEDLLANSRLVERGIADAEAFENHVVDTFDPEGGQRPIWDLLMTELWLRERG